MQEQEKSVESDVVSLGNLMPLVENRLWLRVLIGMLLGVGLGILLSSEFGWFSPGVSEKITPWLALPGKLFVRLVQMIMIPLVFSSIILGVSGSQDIEMLRKTGLSLLVYFVATTIIAIAIGIGVEYFLTPSRYFDAANLSIAQVSIGDKIVSPGAAGIELTYPDRIVNVLPSNPLSSMVSGEMLSIVVFSIIVGLAVLTLRKELFFGINKGLEAVQDISITITKWAMKIAPLAVFGLMCEVTSQVGFSALTGLALYTISVILALLVLVIFYLMIMKFWSGISPVYFLKSSKELLLLAFSMSSSAAVMPLTIKLAEEKFGVRKRLSRFIIPVGATINMDGTAIFQVITTLFLADLFGIGLDSTQLILLSITTVAASIGTPSAPGAGVVILGSILGSVGIPLAAIGVIIGVERILGMFRTSVNVMGDLCASMFFERLETKQD
jgi:Na+/H+-dicarboxylate symporter